MSSIGKPGYDPYLGKMRGVLQPGAGIDISAGTVSVIEPPDGVPYVAGDGIGISGATVYTDLTAGFGTEIAGGTVAQARYVPVETISGSSVTMQAGHAYTVYATTSAVTLDCELIPADKYGLDAHLEVFVAATGYIVAGTNVVLNSPLEPDAVNNCQVRFHDGLAIINVIDHIAGYVVLAASGSTAGTLPYALASASQDYVSFDASLDGLTIDMGGAVTNSEKHVVGRGYTSTTLTGSVSCTSKTTFAALAMSGAVVTGGTMTLGDVFVASVAVSGGALVLEKVVGSGGVIDLGDSTSAVIPSYLAVTVSGVDFVDGRHTAHSVFRVTNSATFSRCGFYRNTGVTGGGALVDGGTASYISCTISGNTAANGAGIYIGQSSGTYADIRACSIVNNTSGGIIAYGNTLTDIADSVVSNNANYDVRIIGGVVNVSGGTIGLALTSGGTMTLAGNVAIAQASGGAGSVTISSGASVNLTTSITPGGGITVLGGCTINNKAVPASPEGTPYTSIVSSGGELYIDGEPVE